MILHGPGMLEVALILAAWLVVFVLVWALLTFLWNLLKH